MLVEPDDRVALRTWAGLGSDSARAGGWTRIRNYCLANGVSPREVLTGLATGAISLPHTGRIVDPFNQLNARLQQLQGLTGQPLIRAKLTAGELPRGDWDRVRYLRTGFGTCSACEQPIRPTDVPAECEPGGRTFLLHPNCYVMRDEARAA